MGQGEPCNDWNRTELADRVLKSGIGGQDLILKYPNLFTLVASWDFPADMSSYNEYQGAPANYGTEANSPRNYSAD